MNRSCIRWTPAEVAILKKHYKKLGGDVQEYLPHKTKIQINSAAARRGLKKKYWRWSDTELELLKKFYESDGFDTKSRQRLLKTRNKFSIITQAAALGLSSKSKRIRFNKKPDKSK